MLTFLRINFGEENDLTFILTLEIKGIMLCEGLRNIARKISQGINTNRIISDPEFLFLFLTWH